MASSRRVKRGPGRRPQSAKRQRFMELRARGWSIVAAAREVVVSRSTGKNWHRGHKVYRGGRVVGFVPALDRLAVREISTRFLTQDERIEIADLRQRGLSLRAIAAALNRSPSTISRELRRNTVDGRGYRPFDAHRRATVRRARHHRRRIDTSNHLGSLVAELLSQRWSPEQISRHLRQRFPDDPSMRLSHESIYQAVYQPGSRFLRPSPLAPHRRSPLRTGRDHRRAHQRGHRRRPRFAHPMLTIHDRLFPPEDRSQAGHWEGDLMVGHQHGSAIGTLVERQTRMVRRLHLPVVTPTRSTLSSSPGCGTYRRGCCGRSPGTRAPRWPGTPPPQRFSVSPSTSVTPDPRGSADRTRTRTGCCETTSRKASASPATHRSACWPSERTQQPSPHDSQGPLPGRSFHRLASLAGSVRVATLTRTSPVAMGSFSDRRRQPPPPRRP